MASSQKPSILVRPADESDLKRILEIECAAPSAGHWSHSDYQAAFSSASPPRTLLVGEMNGHVGGFLVARCSLVSEWESEWEIENVVVAATMRRHGLGAALIGMFLEQVGLTLPTKDDLVVYLEVRESNVAARRLYEKCGFHIDSRRRDYYRSPDEDAVVYRYIFQ